VRSWRQAAVQQLKNCSNMTFMKVLTATGFSLRLAGVISERDPLDEICRELTSFKLEWADVVAVFWFHFESSHKALN
jgi:hypothetical protein